MTRVRLRHLIFIAFVLVSWLPVVGFTFWVHQSAFEKEVAAVEEKHLLLSQHLTRALTRYVTDAETAFRTIVIDLAEGRSGRGQAMLLSGMHFRHVCVVDADGRVVRQICGPDCRQLKTVPTALRDGLAPLVRRAHGAPGKVVFSDVMANDAGAPAVYLGTALEHGRTALGELSNAYLRDLQKSIAFGRQGHAAIVDRTGRVLAHPRDDWVHDMKDLSKVGVVAAMMDGGSGVARFHAPALDADMIAGFSTVAKVGWGVMVPQPLAELREKAGDVGRAAIILGLVALIGTGLASWLLASYVDRAIRPVVQAARHTAEGNLGTEARGLPRRTPVELRELADAFNVMARRIRDAFRHERDALDAARAAQDTNRAKSEFLAKVSHEFRTPLNAILGFSEMLQQQILGPVGNDRYVGYADAIHRSGRHLLGLIDDVLDISRSELGRSSPREEWVRLDELFDDATTIVREAHRDQTHDRAVTLESGLPAVKVDRQMLRQILINLLSNAEKFTPDGGRIVLAARRMDSGAVDISVSDTGVGIDPADIDLVLAPFGRVSKRTDARPGTGLGLTVAKSLAELHGGTLAIESTPGVGTTVHVVLPSSRVGAPAEPVVVSAKRGTVTAA